MSEGTRGGMGEGGTGGEWSGLWTAEPTLTFSGTRREFELFVEALLAVAAGAVMWVAFGGARVRITPDAAPAYDLQQLADAVTRMLAVGGGRCEVACRFGGAARVAVMVTSDDDDAALSAPHGGVGAPGDADGGGEGDGAREGTTGAAGLAFATAVSAALSTPAGQRLLAEHHLREDASRWPACAAARRAVVAWAMEPPRCLASELVPGLLERLRGYEERRGGGCVGEAAAAYAVGRLGVDVVAVYERARGVV